MILVFDLDDTLYNETDFVLGGFQAVARYLFKKFGINEKDSFSFMKKRIDQRGSIFDQLLKKHNIYSAREVKNCIKVYRYHKPKIDLTKAAKECLKRFQSVPKYVVTDGHKEVQRSKLKALKLDKYMVRCLPTNAYGKNRAKPNPFCFLLIARMAKMPAEKIIYIADNPKKDFVGIKPLGFKTVRLLKGPYRKLKMPPEFEADLVITSLGQLTNAKILRLID